MSILSSAIETHRTAARRLAPHYRVAQSSLAAGGGPQGAHETLGPVQFTSAIPVMMPPIAPTVAPIGRERLIAVRNVREAAVVVRGAVTGREYTFAAMEAQDVPLADARLLVSGGDFAFSGGR